MELKYNSDGLIPVIVQDYLTNQVLMLAYMNEEAFDKTVTTDEMYYYSRSRQELWKKGETSGNFQYLKSLQYDCDKDTLLARVEQVGVVCHTGNQSCFYQTIKGENETNILNDLYNLIKDRKQSKEKGYTTYLFEKGLDKILKKVAEESGEVIIASKNNNEETVYEIADLIYHLLVLMVNNDIEFTDILKELKSRRK